MSLRAAAAKQASRLAENPAANKLGKAISKSKPAPDEPCAFSFRFFREIDNFGLDSKLIEKGWSISFLNRLQELSSITVVALTENRSVMEGTLRIHDIDWDWTNIPIKRENLDWIDKDYLGNPEEFPMIQIAVSKALGRIVGFFDERNHFQIVLLDPLHNAQPCKKHEYKVRLCKPIGCEITAIRAQTARAMEKIKEKDCGYAEELARSLEWVHHQGGSAVVIASLEENLLNDADEIMKMGAADSHAEIFQMGIDAALAKPAPAPAITSPAQPS